MKIITNLGRLLAAVSSAVLLATPAHASLQGRDLDGNGVTDAFYDTTLNITWLRNANVNGAMNWDAANDWANGYSFGGYSDWRLPTLLGTAATADCNWSYAGGTNCGHNVDTATSEIASLWYDTLGNKAYCDPATSSTNTCNIQAGWGLTNTGGFEYMQSFVYWFGTEYAPYPTTVWVFGTGGGQSPGVKDGPFYAMAVRSGDVRESTVPEPESLVLALTALGGLGLLRQRHFYGASAPA